MIIFNTSTKTFALKKDIHIREHSNMKKDNKKTKIEYNKFFSITR